MKNVSFITVSLATLLSLALCKGPNRKTNYFVPGNYVGANEKNEEDIYYLRVESITEEAYIEFNGINVVEDIAKGGYYYLDLYKLDESNNKIVTTFINLEDYNVTTAMPIKYADKNGNSIRPHNFESPSHVAYSVTINNEGKEIFIYFHKEAND